MVKKRNIALTLVIFLVLTFLTVADTDAGIACFDDADCEEFLSFTNTPGEYYCDILVNSCFIMDEIADPFAGLPNITTSPLNTTTLAVQETIDPIQENITQIKKQLSQTNVDIAQIKSSLSSIQTQIMSLQQKVDSINTIDTEVQNLDSEVNTIATGLAGLQESLDSTKTEVDTLEESLDKRPTLTKAVVAVLFILLVIALTLGIIYYITRGKKQSSDIHPQIVHYITSHIKEGKKYPHIKENLLKAGWKEEDIEWAYKSTIKNNYKSYKQNNPTKPLDTKQEPLAQGTRDPKKVITIAVVSILLIIGVFFLLSGVVGNAIFVQSNFGHDAPFICTPPHMVTQGGCCLDVNNNTLCDLQEAFDAQKVAQSLEMCSDHRECQSGELCIDNKCGTIEGLYDTSCSGQVCNFNTMRFDTSDGETYNLFSRGKGSYTAAGAITWTTLKGPNYCKGQEIIVPIEISKIDRACYDNFGDKVTCQNGMKSMSEIISKEIITLKVQKTSKEIVHPNPKINLLLNPSFRLKLQSANEICFNQ